MKSSLSAFASLAVLITLGGRAAAVAVWGQCGGINYSGDTTCAAGSTCIVVNDYYWQCQPGSATTTTPGGGTSTSTAPPTSTNPAGCTGTLTKFKYFGVNQSGAEFGNTKIPGVLGTDYTWPATSSIDYFVGQGFNTFRVPFQQERISPPANGLTGAFDATYLNGLKTIVNYITNKGAYAIIEPHNFMRYNGAVITSTANFQTWWKNLANEFKSNSRVIFDIMNEPNGIDAQTVFNLNQAAVNGIRSSGATSQLITVEAWTGAWSWTSSGNSNVFGAIKDPNNNVAIQMHQYLDSDSSGTSATCVSSTIGAERLAAATAWLKANNLKGFLGEIGAGSNAQCISAVKGALCSMQQSGVWIGAAWWAAGPWWGTYFQSIEPPNGAAISQILPQALKPFL
ncbi:endoglucanase [Lyophyllum atratum]|nr:endoglucanase [Lyophyllum atratum]